MTGGGIAGLIVGLLAAAGGIAVISIMCKKRNQEYRETQLAKPDTHVTNETFVPEYAYALEDTIKPARDQAEANAPAKNANYEQPDLTQPAKYDAERESRFDHHEYAEVVTMPKAKKQAKKVGKVLSARGDVSARAGGGIRRGSKQNQSIYLGFGDDAGASTDNLASNV